jgi:competence protein ComGC
MTNHRGFTLIELIELIALMAVIAIIAAISIPNLIEARKGSNEAAAVGALKAVSTAQESYREGDLDRNGVRDYAPSLQALAAAGLIDAALASGTKQGYQFTLESNPGQSGQYHWGASAAPRHPGKSGDRFFSVDESGVIQATVCPPGFVAVKDREGNVTCQRAIALVPGSDAAQIGAPMVETLELAHAGFLPSAKELVRDTSFVRDVHDLLDADHDGKLTFSEVLDTDLVQLSRTLARAMPGGSGEAVGDDSWLGMVARRFQAVLQRSLQLGEDETELPAVQIDGLLGHPAAVLELAAEDPRYARLNILRALLRQLEPEDMNARGEQAGDHRAQLVAAAESLHDLLRFGQLALLRQRVEWIRDRSRAWANEPAATAIGEAANDLLAILTTREVRRGQR